VSVSVCYSRCDPCLSCVCLSVCLTLLCLSVCLYVCVSVSVCTIQHATRRPRVSRTVPSETHAAAAAAAAAVDDDDPNRKIDWHDYAQIARDEQRTGSALSLSSSSSLLLHTEINVPHCESNADTVSHPVLTGPDVD